MIKRQLKTVVEQSLKHFPAVGLIGSRQVGKTTLAKEIANKYRKKTIYLDLELPSDLNKLQDPELYLKQYENSLVIIDEIQKMPELFPLLRALIDQKRTAGRFLILGSASPALIKHSSESLAGRIIYHHLTPFLVGEIGSKELSVRRLWLRGGYPESFLAKSDELSLKWRENFIKTFIERDIPQLDYRIAAKRLKNFLSMVAHLSGQLLNASQIANSLDISSPVIKNYLDIFEETFILRRLPPYYVNIKKRLVKSPKIYIRDSGLLHYLLGNQTFDNLLAHPAVGASWEGFVVEQLLGHLPPNYQPYFFRTSAGAEIDLLFASGKDVLTAFEIKYSLSPKLSKGFWQAFKDLSCRKGYIIYPGKEKYSLAKNIIAWPLSKIGELRI
jgi:hypothetical protein